MTQHTYLEPGGRDAIGPACANDAAASHLPGGAVSSAAAAAALDSGVRVVHGEDIQRVMRGYSEGDERIFRGFVCYDIEWALRGYPKGVN